MQDAVLFVHAVRDTFERMCDLDTVFEKEDDVLVLMARNFVEAVSGMYEVSTSTNATKDFAAVNKVVLFKEFDEGKNHLHLRHNPG
ncbi:hypothetical protein PF005_g438 [Phytophthora fragariae]|uniref:Uncharacterized protein n=2 Tax=Phytophthora fragariae TaxID=53985 RepID=A0A6A3MI29_9STRA|nr:hypothetical protein PF011_g257 [Phytophthora fragariae]KAE9237963.1 hypothetical protein PF005_g438 [Phytophthora fragariae]